MATMNLEIVMMTDMLPDACDCLDTAMRRVEEVRQAATTEQKQQLTMNLARKAKSAPKEMGKEFSDSYLPLWAFKHSFVCSGRQPTSDEGDRNEALLGFRNASQFLKAMEKALGTCSEQLLHHSLCNGLRGLSQSADTCVLAMQVSVKPNSCELGCCLLLLL